jgi:hypothetical protein
VNRGDGGFEWDELKKKRAIETPRRQLEDPSGGSSVDGNDEGVGKAKERGKVGYKWMKWPLGLARRRERREWGSRA